MALASFPHSASAAQSERAWEFQVHFPGTYKVQVHHGFSGIDGLVADRTEVRYSVSIDGKIRTRSLVPSAERPLIAFIADFSAPQRVRVAVGDLPPEVLQRTVVYFYDALSVPRGEYYDPRRNSFAAAEAVRALLAQTPDAIDLGRTKLAVDKLIDSSVDIDAGMKSIESMVASIKSLTEYGTSNSARLAALRTYLYEAGAWNNGKYFEYDLEDPLGKKISNKLLPRYLATNKGNCVTMPLLAILLGQRLGLTITAAKAPKHILVKWKNDAGAWVNLEATSGLNPARDSWIRRQMPMTDQAIANGLYLRPLTKTETVGLMVTTLAEHYLDRREYRKAVAVADMVLEHYPGSAETMVLKAVAFGRLTREEFAGRYQTPAHVLPSERERLEFLSMNNQRWFAFAERLGWRAETEEDEVRYLQGIDGVRREKAAIGR